MPSSSPSHDMRVIHRDPGGAIASKHGELVKPDKASQSGETPGRRPVVAEWCGGDPAKPHVPIQPCNMELLVSPSRRPWSSMACASVSVVM